MAMDDRGEYLRFVVVVAVKVLLDKISQVRTWAIKKVHASNIQLVLRRRTRVRIP